MRLLLVLLDLTETCIQIIIVLFSKSVSKVKYNLALFHSNNFVKPAIKQVLIQNINVINKYVS